MHIFKEEEGRKPKQIFGKRVGKDIFAITFHRSIEKGLGINNGHHLYDILQVIAPIRMEPPSNCRCAAFVGEKNGKKNQVTIRFSNINKRMRVDIIEIDGNKKCPENFKKTILEKFILSVDKMGLGDLSSKAFLEHLKEV